MCFILSFVFPLDWAIWQGCGSMSGLTQTPNQASSGLARQHSNSNNADDWNQGLVDTSSWGISTPTVYSLITSHTPINASTSLFISFTSIYHHSPKNIF